jgi:hypothetical protein
MKLIPPVNITVLIMGLMKGLTTEMRMGTITMAIIIMGLMKARMTEMHICITTTAIITTESRMATPRLQLRSTGTPTLRMLMHGTTIHP